MSQSGIARLLKNELKLKPYKAQKALELTEKQKHVRLQRAEELLRLAESDQFPNIVFSGVKNFPIDQSGNSQNNHIYLTEYQYKNLKHLLATREQHPAEVMVWAAVTADGRSPIVFVDPDIKSDATYYREDVLVAALKPWVCEHFGRRPWTFQQDSAPSHKARVNQEWLKNNVPNFIRTTQWLSNSSDANPLDFSIWTILDSKVRTKKYQNVEELQEAIVREWAKIPANKIRAACTAFFNRLKAIIKAKGGHIGPNWMDSEFLIIFSHF